MSRPQPDPVRQLRLGISEQNLRCNPRCDHRAGIVAVLTIPDGFEVVTKGESEAWVGIGGPVIQQLAPCHQAILGDPNEALMSTISPLSPQRPLATPLVAVIAVEICQISTKRKTHD